MSNTLLKVGAKAPDGKAKPVNCNSYGNLIIDRDWEQNVIKIYDGAPSGDVFTDVIPLDKVAVNSLRVINSTNAAISIALEQDYPVEDKFGFGWQVGTIRTTSGENPTAYFDDSTDAYKGFVSTPELVTIGNRDIVIKVDTGYTLTAYNFDSNGNYLGTYSTTNGTKRTFIAGEKKLFRLAPNEGRVAQTDIYNYLEHINILPNGGKHLYNLLTGEQIKVTVPASNEGKIYTITPGDMDILNYLESLRLLIQPQETVESGLFTVMLITKK